MPEVSPTESEPRVENDSSQHPTVEERVTDELPETTGGSRAGAVPLLTDEMTSQHIAGLLVEDDCEDHWHLLLWALVDEDDLPSAYWLARWLAASGRAPASVSPGLLAAAQGARWLSPNAETFSVDLQEITLHEVPDVQRPEHGLIGLAAALRPALLAPLSGLASWLRVPDVLPSINELHALIPAIDQFAERAIALRSEDLEGVTGAEQRAEAIAAVVTEARRWAKDAPNRGHNTGRASSIWKHLVGPSGNLRALLQPVTEGTRADVSAVRQQLSSWQDRGAVAQRIDDAFREVVRATTRPLPTPMRQVLERNIAEAIELAQRWCTLVERDRRYAERGDWMAGRISELREKSAQAMPPTYRALADLSTSAREQSTRAAARCLWRALVQLADTLQIPQPGTPTPPSLRSWTWLTEQSLDLQTALARRLLWLPELALATGVDRDPDLEDVALVGTALRTAYADQRSWLEAFDGWLDKQDFRFCSLLEHALPEAERAPAGSRSQEMLEGSRSTLREWIVKTENRIEQAVVDGILDDAGRAEHGEVVAKITPEGALHFGPEYAKLEGIRSQLDLARRQRTAVLGEEWNELAARMVASPINQDQEQAIRHRVERALAVQDTRVVDELLAKLRSTLEGGSDSALQMPDGVVARDTLADFLQQAQSIEQAIVEGKVDLQKVARDIEKQKTILGFPYAQLPRSSIEESVAAIQHWNLLKQGQPSGQHVVRNVERLLIYLGFEVLPSGLFDEPVNRGPSWAHVRIQAAASSDSAKPIAQFGSRAPEYQDVICFWSRPIAETVSDSLQRLGITDQHALVFYLGRLTHHERTNLGRQFQARKTEIVVMDEIALLYLSRERDVRLRTLLRCALPYTAYNPYTPFQAGDVPPEMFFGREDMAKELQRREGSCLVYGGRQLGKSALLRHVQWRVHNPEQQQYAHVLNMKMVYDPAIGKRTDNIWPEIRDRLRDPRDGFLPAGIRSDKPDVVRRHIRDSLLEVPSRRVLLMFDEADQFLDAEAQEEFRNIRALRELMLETKGQFKVVFAGLHNVQRFQNIPNQPLAHFGNPILVGPLEPDAAQRLVCEPLETLGYRFADDTIVLRILSYTNYHPGLIQLFCQELLHDMRRHGAGNQVPPYAIDRARVEGVYLRVRDYVRERFELTLALDPRYQAIAWAMIVDQMETRDGFAHPYSDGDVLRLVAGWWPAGFRLVDQQQMRGLLDEMIGLGVLARTSRGLYRLRSPNLVRLMGTEQDIGDRLLNLEQSTPPPQPGAADYHALLDQQAGSYSPLAFDQESRAFPQRTGVTVVFACPAQGLASLAPAFERLAPTETRATTTAFTSMSTRVSDATDMRHWLDSFLGAHERHEKLLVHCQPLGLTGSQIRGLVNAALEVCQHIEQRQRRSQQQWLRACFVLDPANTWAWLSLPADARQDLENRIYPEWPRPWTLAGIRHRLQQHQMVDLESVCQALLDATGGWQMLLDQVFSRCGRQDDPRPVAHELQVQLAQPDNAVRKQFHRSLGLPNDLVRAVLAYVVREEEALRELLDADCVPDVPTATAEECDRAVEFLLRLGPLRICDGVLVPDPVVARVLRAA